MEDNISTVGGCDQYKCYSFINKNVKNLFSNGSDVIRENIAATTDVSYASIVRISSKLLYVKSSYLSGLQGWKITNELKTTI